MRGRTILYSLFSILWPLAGCHDIARVDSKGIQKEMEERTVYHINDTELLQGAQRVGDRITTRIDSAILEAVGGSTQASVDFIVARDAAPYKIEVHMLPFDALAGFKATAKEREVLDALAYTHQQGQAVTPNIQKLEDKSFQYIRPIAPFAANATPAHPLPDPNSAQTGIYYLRIPTRPAALEASKGKKGMK